MVTWSLTDFRKTELANKFYASFMRTGNPCFYMLAVDSEKTEILKQKINTMIEDELTL